MPTWRGISYVELAESSGSSPTYNWQPESGGGTRIFRCAWDDAITLERELMGYEYAVVGQGVRNHIVRKTPFPDSSRLTSLTHTGTIRPYLYVTRVETKGRGLIQGDIKDASGYPKYEYGVLTCTFSTLPYDVLEDYETTRTQGVPDESYWERYITRIPRPQGEFITLRPAAGATRFSYVGTTPLRPVNTDGIAKILSFCNLQITWHRVPERAVPSVFVNPLLTTSSHIENTLGKVNGAAFNGYPQATLLLLGAQMRPYRGVYGNRLYDVTYMMKFNPNTHQKLLDPIPDPPAFVEVTTDGTTNLVSQTAGYSIYDFATFENLFRVPTTV